MINNGGDTVHGFIVRCETREDFVTKQRIFLRDMHIQGKKDITFKKSPYGHIYCVETGHKWRIMSELRDV